MDRGKMEKGLGSEYSNLRMGVLSILFMMRETPLGTAFYFLLIARLSICKKTGRNGWR